MIQAATRPGATESPPRHRGRAALPALALACIAGTAFFALAFGAGNFRLPWGDDTYFYVNAIRTAGRMGLADSHLAARPGFPLVAATFSSVLGMNQWAAGVAVPMAMGSGLGLAAGAFAARWGLRRWPLGAYVFLAGTCVITARLLAGKSENLMTLWLLAAAVAMAAWGGRRRGTVAAGALAFGAGLTEWPFLVAFAGLVAVTLLAGPPLRHVLRRRGNDRGPGIPSDGPSSSGPVPGAGLSLPGLALGGVGALAATALVVLVLNGSTVGDAIQRLPPAFRYRGRYINEMALIRPVPTALAFLAGVWAARRHRAESHAPTTMLLSTWTVLTLAVLAVGLAGAALPTYRALTFALPAVLALAAAPFVSLPALSSRSRDRGRAVARVLLAAGMAALVLIPAARMWYGFTPQTNPHTLGQIDAAAHYAEGQAGDGPTVLVVDTELVLRGYFYERLFTAASSSAPGRLVVFTGRAEDALAGRPTRFDNAQSNTVSRDLFERVGPALAAGAPILAARGLDRSAYELAVISGRPLVADGVAVLRGPPPGPALAGVTSDPIFPLPRWHFLWAQALAILLVLVLAGAGWAELALPSAPLAVRAAVAPAFGAVALLVVALALERFGFPPAGWAGPAAAGATVGLGVSLAIVPRILRRWRDLRT